MSVRVQPSRIYVMDHSGKDHLLSAVPQARTQFFDLVDNLDAEGWETPTACTEWQVRDVAAYMRCTAGISALDSDAPLRSRTPKRMR